MNVKEGDVAIIIKGRRPNVGKIVYVAQEAADRDYRFMGYDILPSWIVESLGGTLDTEAGPAQKGFTPDISLRRLNLTPEQAKAMRTAKAEHDIKAALDELAEVLAEYIDEPEKDLVCTGNHQCANIPTG
jgi:hypothetical protein